MKMRILMCVGWVVQRTKVDDKRKHLGDLLLLDQKYWFFKHWPEDLFKVEI